MPEHAVRRFAPDAVFARGLDRNLRVRLADSLEHIADKSRGRFVLDVAKLQRLTSELRRDRRFPPTTFALYYDLVDAILEDRLEDAGRYCRALVEERPIDHRLSVAAMDDATLGREMVERYGRMMDTDAATPHAFAGPSEVDVTSFRPLLDEALLLFERGCPRTYAEFVELVDQIVLCNGTNLTTGDAFLAGSSFTVWGGLFINPSVRRTVRSVVETLAHEAAHSLLFGFQISGPLVLNPDEERFPSPLRADPRPMDGVYHATFVSARMHFAMMELLASGLADGPEGRFLREAADRDRANFIAGLRTVKEFGRLTPAGQEVMAGAEAYIMAQAA